MRAYALERRRKGLLTITFVALSVLSATAQTPAIRDVTPLGVTRVYRSNDTPVDNSRTFVGTRVDNNGQLHAEGVILKLDGILLPPRKKVCVTANGRHWACGQRAYLRLRNLVERRSIACQIKDVDKRGGTNNPRLAVCKVEGADVAISLLQDGLADLADGAIDKTYIAAASLAKTKKTGLWADVP